MELTVDEARDAYACIVAELRSGYAKSGNETAEDYGEWTQYNTAPYQSATHGGQFVNNYGNRRARKYRKYEDVGTLRRGSILAKDSYRVSADGKVTPGPLFLMEKMRSGFREDAGNWKYTMIMPNGAVFGETNGPNSQSVEYCVECHAAVGDFQDHLYFIPDEFRVSSR